MNTNPNATKGRIIQNTQCHENFSATHAATPGPRKAGIIQHAENHVMIRARSTGSYPCAVTTSRHRLTAPPPSPWTNRPTSRTIMVGASAATTTPAAKTNKPISSGRTGPVRSTMRPVAAMANNCGIITAEKAHA